jgi:hypothetical protein
MIGSYHNGFAPRDGEPEYPQLWRGLVGAWAPCLGPTGATLRDWSGRANHGTLTNMDAGTDWLMSSGYSLDFDSSDDYVLTTNTDTSNTFTLAAWIRPTTVSGVKGILVADTTAYRRGVWVFDGAIYGQSGISADTFMAGSVSANAWQHVAMTVDQGVRRQLYVNGKSVYDTTVSGTVPSCTVPYNIGRSSGNEQYFSGLLDDVRTYSRALNASEVAILSMRRGVSFEMRERRRARSAAVNRRRRFMVASA